MKTIRGSQFSFQVSERLQGRYAGLSRRGRIILGASAFTGLAWLLGLPQSLWRHIYVWLAYPPTALIQAVSGPLNGHMHIVGWGAWTTNIDARYAWLHTAAHGGMGGVIAIDVALPFILCGVLAWRVGWFIYTRPRRLTPSTAHGSARLMTDKEMRQGQLVYTGTPLLLGTRGRTSVALDRSLQVLNVLLVGPPNTGKSAGFVIPNLRREDGRRSVVVTDLKNELLKKSYGALSDQHDVWVLNFLSPATSLGYNPLAYCTDPLATALFGVRLSLDPYRTLSFYCLGNPAIHQDGVS